MPDQPVSKKQSRQHARFNYAVEPVVDRTVREQNRFLEHCQTNRVELTVFAITGASFNGIVHQFDRETILFGGSGKNAIPRLILKTFVAMIIPREAINLFVAYKGLGTARTKNRKQRFIAALERLGEGSEQEVLVEPQPMQQVEPAPKPKAKRKPADHKARKGSAGRGKANPAAVTTKPRRRTVTTALSED
ncbi:RNA chaperone Hfq [Pseudomonas putida]|uniref:RNA chaperone Hfq n=1 Tax=Pseudomonas putida TaxID=303 RepID=UPI002364797B|nr:RNA chaperone Hfq [Pseudomonas putida]MDD2139510.1 RNA chaperone Hfq [Pseudomonas putida]HDS1721838.1 RNA chaperone Hfq [Pseudomonas putida]